MKKVLMLLENEFPHDDRVEKEALSLIKANFKVYLLCPTFSGQKQKEVYNGIEVLRFAMNKTVFKKLLGLIQLFPFYRNLWKRKAIAIIKKESIDIVHLHDLPLCCLIDPLSSYSHLKFVADMHENYPAMVAGQEHMQRIPNKYLISVNRWYRLEKKWLQGAGLIICTASGMIKRLQKEIGDNHNFVLVPNTVDIEKFQQSQVRNAEVEKRYRDDFLVLSYGVVSKQRGVQYAIGAINMLKEEIPAIKLLILGDGSYINQLKEQVRSLELGAHVIFEGWQKQAHLISYMENTDVCIIPHIKSEHTDNTSPNKLFHFMYFGKPVVASNCNYIQEIVEEEQCGLIYNYQNESELANSILDLYKSNADRNEMGIKGLEAIKQKYNWEVTAAAMAEKYMSLADA